MMTFNRMLVLATMIFMGLTTASAQLIGVDTGSMYFKVALVKPGSPFQIVTNVHSKRKTETILGFEDAERRFGGDAVTLASRRPQQAIAFVPRLLGRSTKHPALERLASQYLPFLVEEDAARGTANLTVQGGGSAEDPDISLSPEEAMAMILTHAKSNADRFSGGRVTDAVLTVPSYFTVSERDAMRDAAHIAGLKVLSLIEENTAAALQYGISRIFPNETHTVLIYNMGASSTQVSVFEFTTYTAKKSGKNQTFGQFETIGKSWDENLGGFAFDLKLVEFMADAFNGMKQRKGKKDVRTNHRSMAKLRKSAEKVKKVLSANKQYPITIESLCDDMDFRGTSVTREQFEKMTEDLMDRVLGPVERALEMANRTIDQISQVEIIGGGVRVPKVQELLADFFQLKAVGDLGVHLNGDEAMALGAAFRAANMSKAFRVGRAERSVGMIESTYFPIGLRLEELEKTSATAEKEGEAADGEDAEVAKTDAEAETEADTEGEGKTRKKWSKRVSLFSRKSELLKKKKIKLTHDHDFTVTLKYDSHSKAPMDESIGNVFREFNITGLEKFATGDKKHLGTPQVELVFQLDSNGVPIITKAEAKLEEIVIEAPKEEKKEESEESNDEESKDEETKDEEAKDEEAKDEEAKDEETKEDGEKKSDDDKAEEKKKPKKPKTKKRIHRVQLKVTQVVSSAQTVRRMTAKDAKDASRRLRDMEAADELRQKRDAEKNSLESFVFEIRGQVRDNEEDLSKVSPEEEREKILEDLEALEDWLYEDGEDGGANAELSVYQNKRKDMTNRVKAIFTRLVELEKRPIALKAARDVLVSTKEIMLLWPTERPHVSEEETKEVEEVAEAITEWLDEKEAEQKDKEDTDKPAFTSKEVSNKLQKLNSIVSRLLKKKRPETEKPKKEGDKDDKDDQEKTEEKTEEDDDTEEKADDAKEEDESAEGDKTDEAAEEEESKEEESKSSTDEL